MNETMTVQRSLPHGHALAALGTAHQLGLERILARTTSRYRQLALAAIIARIINPSSQLGTARTLSPETAASSLGKMLDWLRARQPWIERSLANRHLEGGTLLLYDVSSSYVEGRKCPLAAFGHNRDGKKGKRQITFGLLCAPDGCPIAIEVFAGNTGDPTTLTHQVTKLQDRFGISSIAVVGDRGMITSARVREDLKPRSLDWISAFKTADIRKLLKPSATGETPLQLDDMSPDQVAEITHPEYPGERLLVCLNPRLRAERARQREALLQATETILADIARHVHRKCSTLRGQATIGRRVGREANRHKVEKHFDIRITDIRLSWSRKEDAITEEVQLDGLYVIRTSLTREAITGSDAVAAYQSLAQVERAFRSCKSTRLHIRPVFVHTAEHVRGHVFPVLLDWYVEWHMRRALAQATKTITPDSLPVHSMTTLLADLATFTLNEVVLPAHQDHSFTMTSQPTTIQARAFELLKIKPERYVAM